MGATLSLSASIHQSQLSYPPPGYFSPAPPRFAALPVVMQGVQEVFLPAGLAGGALTLLGGARVCSAFTFPCRTGALPLVPLQDLFCALGGSGHCLSLGSCGCKVNLSPFTPAPRLSHECILLISRILYIRSVYDCRGCSLI